MAFFLGYWDTGRIGAFWSSVLQHVIATLLPVVASNAARPHPARATLCCLLAVCWLPAGARGVGCGVRWGALGLGLLVGHWFLAAGRAAGLWPALSMQTKTPPKIYASGSNHKMHLVVLVFFRSV
jgi:hypothetical protein